MVGQEFREVFIFIAGATPQVVTETIYALSTQNPPVHADELCIITTGKGREIVRDALIKRGILKKLTEEYSLPPLVFPESSFVVPADPNGIPLEDIRTEAENEVMGDLITSLIREKAKDQTVRLHCSIAGGRKTMSFYLGAAMQLFARPWDRLYHVLVSPEFESNPQFFYKPKEDSTIDHKGGRLNTSDAEIILAELPFIRLRDKLSLEATTFKNLVLEGQQEVDAALVHPEMRVSLSKRTVRIGSCTVRLQPLHLMIYLAYLRRKLDRCLHPEKTCCLDCTACFPAMAELTSRENLEEMARDYALMAPSRASDLLHSRPHGIGPELIRQAISKIRKILSDELGDEALASYYAVTTSFRGYADSRHGVRAEKRRIRIEP